jgi:cytochrome c-type biogenesis protein CcsB
MSVNESLAGTSDALTVSAMTVYTLALLAFLVDLLGGSRAAGAGRADAEPEESTVSAGVPVAATAAGSPGVPVAATAVGSPVGTVVGSADGAATGDDPSARVAADPQLGSTAAADRGGPAGRPTGRRSRAGGIAIGLFVLATALHLAAVTARGLAAGRVPWSNAYEFALTGALAVSLLALALLIRRGTRWLGAFVTLPVLLTLGLATSVFYAETTALAPALQSFWLVIHVSVAFVGSALLTLGFSVCVLQLVQHRADTVAAQGGTRPRLLRSLPDADALEATAFRLNAAGFVLWSFTLVAGAIWAEHAWGRYWGWDPKETWSLVIWVVYAGYLHARVTAGWGGRRAAWLSVSGYACLLFNFFGVNYLLVGNHSYAQ